MSKKKLQCPECHQHRTVFRVDKIDRIALYVCMNCSSTFEFDVKYKTIVADQAGFSYSTSQTPEPMKEAIECEREEV